VFGNELAKHHYIGSGRLYVKGRKIRTFSTHTLQKCGFYGVGPRSLPAVKCRRPQAAAKNGAAIGADIGGSRNL